MPSNNRRTATYTDGGMTSIQGVSFALFALFVICGGFYAAHIKQPTRQSTAPGTVPTVTGAVCHIETTGSRPIVEVHGMQPAGSYVLTWMPSTTTPFDEYEVLTFTYHLSSKNGVRINEAHTFEPLREHTLSPAEARRLCGN